METLDLDHTLIESDKLCKSLNCENYLSVNELAKEVIISGRILHVDIREVNLHDGVVFYRNQL